MKYFVALLCHAGLLAGLALAPALPAVAQYTWAWASAPSGATTSYATHSVVDAQGNLYASGLFRPQGGSTPFDFGNGVTLPLPAGIWATFVAKYDPSGTCQWATSIDNGAPNHHTIILRLAVDPAGNVLAGGYCPDSTWFGAQLVRFPGVNLQGFVGKLSPTGQWQWVSPIRGYTPTFGSPTDMIRVLALTSDAQGNVYAGGTYLADTLRAGGLTVLNGWPGPNGIFVGKLSPTGQWQWVRTPAGRGEGGSTISDLKVDAAGDVYVAGNLDKQSIFGSDTLQGRTYTGAGGPGPAVPPTTTADVFVARLNPAGQWLEAHELGTGVEGHVAFDAAGTPYLFGTYYEEWPYTNPALLGADTLQSQGGFVLTLSRQGRWWSALRHTDKGSVRQIGPDGTAYVLGTRPDSLRFGSFYLPARPMGLWLPNRFYVAGLSATNQWLGVAEAVAQPPIGVQWPTNDTLTVPSDLVLAGDHLFVSGQHLGAATFGSVLLTTPPSLRHEQFFLARLDFQSLGLMPPTDATGLALWPNPAHHTVQLTSAKAATAEIIDAMGQVVRRSPFEVRSSTLDLTGLPAGLYVVRCGGQSRRLVVE